MPRYATGPNRYQTYRLLDGRLLALDTLSTAAFLMMPKLANGSYRLSRGGAITVQQGIVTAAKEPANTSGYRIVKVAGDQFLVTKQGEPGWRLVVSSRASAASPTRRAVLDLFDGNLLLVTAQGVSTLHVTPAPRASYRTVSGLTITVDGPGPTPFHPPYPFPRPPRRDIDFDIAEDFAP